ncbi:hypothetical protein V6N11_051029 [Hibiscus sabdariffa]|uniref:Uncharacterized protein n=1 Tax=Hibiscus sabdariffa TaxID=183260 RepID=A0ABR2R2P3_9ROSI
MWFRILNLQRPLRKLFRLLQYQIRWVCPQQPVKPRVLEVKWVPKRFVLEKVVPRVSTVASSGSEVNPVGSVEVSVNEGLTKKGKSFIPASANRFDVLNSMEQQYVASTSVQGGLFLFREVTLLM